MNKLNESRHTITINNSTFQKLKSKGFFGESYSELLGRLLRQVEKIQEKEEKQNVQDP